MSEEKANLYVLIAGKYYLVERIKFEQRPHLPDWRGWKLTHFDDKLNHGPYDIIRDPSGRITCQCADFMMVKQRTTGEPCKHVKALVHVFGQHLGGIHEHA